MGSEERYTGKGKGATQALTLGALRWRARAWEAMAKYLDVWVTAKAMKTRRKALRRLLEEYGIKPLAPLVIPTDIPLKRIGYFARPAPVMRNEYMDEVYVVHTVGFNIVGVHDSLERCERAARRHNLRETCDKDTRLYIAAIDRMAKKSKEDLEYAKTREASAE